MNAWVEISAVEHGHGGKGWEIGHALWTPAKDRSGRDRYAVMRMPRPEDHVIHMIRTEPGRFLIGRSIVAQPAIEVLTPPPQPGNWRHFDSYYRIQLSGFVRFSNPPSVADIEAIHEEDIRADIVPSRPQYHPYATYGDGIRLAQGAYLCLLTNRMLEVYAPYCEFDEEKVTLVQRPSEPSQYIEGSRYYREARYFARNPQLRAEALRRYGTK